MADRTGNSIVVLHGDQTGEELPRGDEVVRPVRTKAEVWSALADVQG